MIKQAYYDELRIKITKHGANITDNTYVSLNNITSNITQNYEFHELRRTRLETRCEFRFTFKILIHINNQSIRSGC